MTSNARRHRCRTFRAPRKPRSIILINYHRRPNTLITCDNCYYRLSTIPTSSRAVLVVAVEFRNRRLRFPAHLLAIVFVAARKRRTHDVRVSRRPVAPSSRKPLIFDEPDRHDDDGHCHQRSKCALQPFGTLNAVLVRFGVIFQRS